MIKTVHIGKQSSNNMDGSLGIVDMSIRSLKDTIRYTGIDLSDNQITIDNPTPGAGSVVAKLDMLFYHRMSIYGDVLSSLVNISQPSLLSFTEERTYNPKLLYRNSNQERAIVIPPNTTNYTFFNTLSSSGIEIPIGSENVFNSANLTLKTDSLPSVIISKDVISKDGWYSIFSIGVCDRNIDPSMVKEGMLVQDTTNTSGGLSPWYGKVYMATTDGADPSVLSTSDWHDITVWSTDISIASVLNNVFPYNPWVRKDIFWLVSYDRLYRDAVLDYVEEGFNPMSGYPGIKANHTAIDYFARRSEFGNAQIILQGTDFYRTHHNFLGNV
jgi:hypothetical protein